MRPIRLLLLPVAIFVSSTSAQTIDQCKQIKDATKRVECYDASTEPPKKPKIATKGSNSPSTSAMVQNAKKSLTSILKDPESVRFEGLVLLESTIDEITTKLLCGTFNAKNSYGGYGDSTIFYVPVRTNGSAGEPWVFSSKTPEGLSYSEKYDYKMNQLERYEKICNESTNKVLWKGK